MNSEIGFETDRLSFSLHFNLRNHKPSEELDCLLLQEEEIDKI